MPHEFVCSDEQIEYAYVKEVRTKGGLISVIIIKLINEVIKKNLMIKKFSKKEENNLFFNHVLTSYNRALLGRAKVIGKGINLPLVTFRDGKVLMRKDRESRSIIIRSFNDIDELASHSSNNESARIIASGASKSTTTTQAKKAAIIQPAILTQNNAVDPCQTCPQSM